MIRSGLETLGGIYQLARLAVLTGFRFRGPWWQWRLHTAFGDRPPEFGRELVQAAIHYGRWIHRMRSRM